MCDQLMKFAPEHCGRLGVWRAALLYDLAANYLDAVLGPCTRARERESLDALEARLTQNARMLQVVRPATRVQATRLHNRNPAQKYPTARRPVPHGRPARTSTAVAVDIEGELHGRRQNVVA